MTAIILLIAALSLLAGFFVLNTGRREPESGKPADHKLNIRKVGNLVMQEVKNEPPEGLSSLECKALELEEEDPIDIFIDVTLPWEKRADAAKKLKEAQITIYANIEPPTTDSQRNDCGVNKPENTATDEENEPPFELTGE